MKVQLNFLKLVYPPISNQEAEWLKDIPEVRAKLKYSNIYMIGQRAESKFEIPQQAIEEINETGVLPFKYCAGTTSSDAIVDFNKLLKYHDVDPGRYEIKLEIGNKLIRIWKCHPETREPINVIDWFTTEKLLFDKWRGHPSIGGLTNYRDFTKYYLHYVGISKKEDSLTRLVVKPHDKRIRILSNESPECHGSRVTDETVLFFFRVEPLRVTTIHTDEEINELINGIVFDNQRIIADSEKAFVHILESKYNTIRFSEYPKGKDGLYGTCLKRYGYVIGEDISFVTDSQDIVGGYTSDEKITECADLILIEGDQVALRKHKDGYT
ncbi:MAG: hypothetical protein JRE64_03645 [Deltaproteobacteria bacterium]|nr:hypothetical protein [Deltaproteobacteria bacterium]